MQKPIGNDADASGMRHGEFHLDASLKKIPLHEVPTWDLAHCPLVIRRCDTMPQIAGDYRRHSPRRKNSRGAVSTAIDVQN